MAQSSQNVTIDGTNYTSFASNPGQWTLTSPGLTPQLDVSGGIGILSNAGSLIGTATTVGNGVGIYNVGTIGTLTNSAGGLIEGQVTGTYSGAQAIGIENAEGCPTGGVCSTISSLFNAGTILGSIGTVGSNTEAIGLDNDAVMGSIQNTGLIEAYNTESSVSGNNSATGLVSAGSVGTITNATGATIEAIVSGTGSGTAVGLSASGTVGAISNAGVIEASGPNATGLSNSASLPNLSNEGTIQASATSTATTSATAFGVVNSGTISTLTNAQGADINGSTDGPGVANAGGVSNSGSITSLSNSGWIGGQGTGTAFGVANDGQIGSLDNASGATLGATTSAAGDNQAWGIEQDTSSTIVSLTNEGTLSASATNTSATAASQWGATAAAINSFGTIGSLSNSGTIQAFAPNGGYAFGVYNASGTASIGELENTGTIDVNVAANGGEGVGINNLGSISTIVNAGIVTVSETNGGSVSNNGAAIGIYNVSQSTAPQTSGTIGSIVNVGAINVTAYGQTASYGVDNYGTIGTLNNTNAAASLGTISAETSNSGAGNGISAGVNNGSPTASIGTLNNDGDIYGDAIVTSPTAGGYGYGVNNAGTIGTITNTGVIGGYSSSNANGVGIENGGTISSITNTGLINGIAPAIGSSALFEGAGIDNAGTIDQITNEGTITGSVIGSGYAYGVVTNGTINSLTNDGTIAGSITNGSEMTAMGVNVGSSGVIGDLENDGTIGANSPSVGYGVYNAGNIGVLDNAGQIGATGLVKNVGIDNIGTIGNLTNTGTITSVSNSGAIGQITNQLQISGALNPTITLLENTGVIGNAGAIAATGLLNSGTIGTLTNSGTITGSINALNLSGGTLGSLTNSGMIAGNITNTTSNDLTISGVGGTLTGFNGAIGSITNTSLNVVFASGSQFLNDNINVGTNTVNNAGATLTVNSPISITGNYSQAAGATLQIGVTGSATPEGTTTDIGYGRLEVSGNATLAAGSSVTLASQGYAFAAGQRYVVVDPAGSANYGGATTAGSSVNGLSLGMNGTAGTVTGSIVANGTHNDLVLTVASVGSSTGDTTGGNSSSGGSSGTGTGSTGSTSSTGTGTSEPSQGSGSGGSGSTQTSIPSSVGTPWGSQVASLAPNAVSGNAQSSLNGLGSYTGIGSQSLMNLQNAVLGALATGNAGAWNRVGQQLSPVQVSQSASAATFGALGVVNTRLTSIHLAQADGASGISTGDSASEWSVWGQGFGGHASQGEIDQIDGYDANYGGLMVGADKAVGDHWHVGGAFSYSHTAIDNTGNTSGDSAGVNSFGFIGYAGYTGNPWYANLSGAVVAQHDTTSRLVNMQGFDGLASGSFNAQQYVLRAEAGLPIDLPVFTVTPIASLSYSYLNQGSYTETGGNGAALSVGSSGQNSVKSSLGAKISKAFQTSYGEIVPDLQVSWVHEYDRARQVVGASFAADPTGQTAFTTVGATPVGDMADVSVGVTLLRAHNLSLSARYELQAGGGFVSQTGSLRLQQQF